MKHSLLPALPIPLLILFAAATTAQTPTKLLDSRDVISGYGLPQDFNDVVINDSGEWLLLVQTDNPDAEADEVLLRSGFVTLAEGDFVGQPFEATIDEFKSLTIDDAGNIAWELALLDPNTQTGTNDGLYWNTRLIALSGDPLLTSGYGPAATFFRFNGFVRYNNANQILIAHEVDDSSIPGIFDQSLLLLSLDDQQNIVSSIDVAHELGTVPMLGYQIPQDGMTINKKTIFDLNDAGETLWQTKCIDSNGVTRDAIFCGDELVAIEGGAAPIQDFNWLDLANVRADLNDRGEFVHEGDINANVANSQGVIVKNNETLVVRERQAPAAVAPVLVDGFSSGTPIRISNGGDVFYRANLTGSVTFDASFFVNDELLVRKGITTIDGLIVSEFVDSDDALTISPDGRYFVFRADLEDGRTGLYVMDLGAVLPLDDCGGNPGTLTRVEGFPLVGNTVTLGMDDGQGFGATPLLLLSYGTHPLYDGCGIPTPAGELVIDFSSVSPFLGLIGSPWGGPPVPLDVPIANDLALVGAKVYAQGFFLDLGNQLPGPAIQGTNAVEIQIGAP